MLNINPEILSKRISELIKENRVYKWLENNPSKIAEVSYYIVGVYSTYQAISNRDNWGSILGFGSAAVTCISVGLLNRYKRHKSKNNTLEEQLE